MPSPRRSSLSYGRRLAREFAAVHRIGGIGMFARYVALTLMRLPRVLRTRTLVPADEGMAGRPLEFRIRGQSIVFDGWLFPGAREIYGREVYFAQPGFQIGLNDTVVDIGANAGVFTTLAAKLGRKVVAIEAQSEFCELICANVRRNGCADRVAVEFGLVGSGTGVFSHPEMLRTASHVRLPPPRLDMNDIVRRHDLARIDFLKIDIEGSEFDLFSGDLSWLEGVQRIAMEVHPEHGDATALVRQLQAHAFEVTLLDSEQRPVKSLDSEAGYAFAYRRSA